MAGRVSGTTVVVTGAGSVRTPASSDPDHLTGQIVGIAGGTAPV